MPRSKRGQVYQIDLGESERTYAVALKRPLYGFFDFMSEGPFELDEVTRHPFAFRCCVFDDAVKSGRWTAVGHYNPGAEADMIEFFKVDKIAGAIMSYSESGVPPRRLTAAEARSLEPASVWSAQEVEDRLRDHFQGLSNKWLTSMLP